MAKRPRWLKRPDVELWYNRPIPLGGDPSDRSNRSIVSRREHAEMVVYFNVILIAHRLMEGHTPPYPLRTFRPPTPRRDAVVRRIRRTWRAIFGD